MLPKPGSTLADQPHATGETSPRQRIVLAKVGLDGHDRGIRVVARGLRDSGFHVIYGGMWQSPEAVAQAVCDEDADWLGLSQLNGAHLSIVPRVVEALRKWGRDDVGIILGGIIPESDIPELRHDGVKLVYGPGTAIASIVNDLNRLHVARTIEQRNNGSPAEMQQRVLLSQQLSAIAAGANPVQVSTDGPKSHCIAFTGSAGVGKSSLIGRLLKMRRTEQRVAVLSCDPESPLTGGALLGDRVRMTEVWPNSNIFMRSLAVPSGSQGVIAHLGDMCKCLGAADFDLTLLETVGIGQGDVAVRSLADRVIVVVQPHTGDEIQWQKAGLLEIADLVVVQKSDQPGSEQFAAELRESLNLPGSREVPVISVSALRNENMEQLYDWVFRDPSNDTRLVEANS